MRLGKIVQGLAAITQFSNSTWRESATRAWRIAARQTSKGTFMIKSSASQNPDRPHIPVMLPEVLRALEIQTGDVVIDATFGAGGYTRSFLDVGAKVIAIDRDPDAISAGQALVEEADGQLILEQGRFSNLDAIAASVGFPQVEALVADIGVSSMQIDLAERGFSFQKDGPLDMRMEQTGVSAADVVNTFERSDLTRIIGILGEERQASRISAEIVAWREKNRSFSKVADLENVSGFGKKSVARLADRLTVAIRKRA